MTQKLHFETFINASPSKVWATMLSKDTYGKWTKAFDPSSTFEGTWGKGSSMKFISSTGDGMLSQIAENIPHQFLSIRHLGMIVNGAVDTLSEQVEPWTHSSENYTLTQSNGGTKLEIDLEIPDEYKQMFEEMWPKALLSLKGICEKS